MPRVALAALLIMLASAFLLLGRIGAAAPVGQAANLRIAVSGGPWAGNDWAAFTVDEGARSLNGDEDTLDTVVCVARVSRLQVFSLGLAVASVGAQDSEMPPVRVAGNYAAVLVSEADQGGRDLNGDGDQMDDVLHVVDLTTRRIRNLGLAVEEMQMSDRWVAVAVPEARQGGQDLNGDGDASDVVLYAVELATGEAKCLRLDASSGIQVAGDRALAAVSEAAQGGKDLNGDGDTLDVVAHLVDLSTGEIRNLGVDTADGFAITPRLAAMAVSEGRQGNRDLNGDRDTQDLVLHVYDLAKNELLNTEMDASGGVAAGGQYAVAIAREARQGGRDLNGDGDLQDQVAQVYDLEARALLNTGLDATDGAWVAKEGVAIACLEANQGNHDLNGDGDQDDSVVTAFFPATKKAWNSGLTFEGEAIAGEGARVAFGVLEADQGDRDLNGDRDTDDVVLGIVEVTLSAPRSQIIPLACGEVLAVGSRAVAFTVPEVDQGDLDLNGNGNADDDVLHLLRWSR
ncbi:MAG: hypothetical protein HY320_03455 [Armatimonadetes bacterium]|nr:hypothetical protein [Armatimonadota bacterium]